MGKILSILILLASCSCWGKSSSIIDDTSDLTARSWLVADETNRVLDGRDTEALRSIASITKVFTVLTVMTAGQDLSEYIPYTKGLKLTRQELIELAMVKSDNLSAELLCKHYRGGYAQCIADMNANARSWGLFNTTLVDATGLMAGNTSTAQDLLKLLNVAENNSEIVRAARKTKVEIMVKRKWLIFKQTNPLIGHKHEFVVSKTGTTNAAGGCIILTVRTEKGLRRVVVLASKNGRTRIPEAEFIIKEAQSAY
jgi:serine-type D-Ala-D-Ala endopeptidase (penicillin-binding protein 7)